DPGYSVLIGLAGSGTLVTRGGELQFGRGSAVILPYAAGAAELTGDAEAIRCRPADPTIAAGPAGAQQEVTA
ncbi:MAG: hypothetical protein ACRDPU_00725, partial [Thermoleophilia bacterium]